ncbi:hypothetical protein [Microbacterium indicum]|uniref:hypothetical protein n=1 Tax=Microbacterium indicum TaxID=358100 RepID=UPI0012EC7E96|nr:hypothetical protein [Microbacterium indicum]
MAAATAAALVVERRSPRVPLVDRFAMRVGLALLVWGSRPARQAAVPERAEPREAYAAHAVDSSLARGALLHHDVYRTFGL